MTDNETILSQKIANSIKRTRLDKGLKQSEVAEKAGINSNYYAKVERGESRLSVITLGKIVKALGIKSSEVLPF